MLTQQACQICTGLNSCGFDDDFAFENSLKKLCKICRNKFKCKTGTLKKDQVDIFKCLEGLLGNYGYVVIFVLSLWIVQVSLHRVHGPKLDEMHMAKKTTKPVVNAMLR